MIIKTDGSYYIIVCEKCGAETRKHKSYCTRYGEAYHFNPELKCNYCGFSAKILYNGITNGCPSLKMNKDTVESPKPTEIEPPSPLNRETKAGIEFSESTKTAANKREVNTEREAFTYPGLIQKSMGSKAKILSAFNTVLQELAREKKTIETVKLILFTNFGIIEGTMGQTTDADGGIRRITGGPTKIGDMILRKLDKEISEFIQKNDLITIFDAKMIPFSNPNQMVTMEVLNLFPDQIVGFTFGEYQYEN